MTRTTSEMPRFREMNICWFRARRLLCRAIPVCMPQIYSPYIHCVTVPLLRLAQNKGILGDQAEASCLNSTLMGGR